MPDRVAAGDAGVAGWISAELQQSVIDPIADFQNPDQEWRRLFSELLGTFFLVTVAAGGGMMGAAFPNTISRTAAVVAPGLTPRTASASPVSTSAPYRGGPSVRPGSDGRSRRGRRR